MGDIILERDVFGWYAQCLQCGYRKDANHKSEAIRLLQSWSEKWEEKALANSA